MLYYSTYIVFWGLDKVRIGFQLVRVLFLNNRYFEAKMLALKKKVKGVEARTYRIDHLV